LALGLSVLAGLSAVFVAAKQSYRYQETSGRLQEDASYALETMARDLRMTGFAGCRGVEITPGPVQYPGMGIHGTLLAASGAIKGPNPLGTVYPADAAITARPFAPKNLIRGFDASVPSAMFAVGSVPTSGTTDSLYITGGSMNAVSVTTPMTLPESVLEIGTDSQDWGTILRYMVVSDCVNSSYFVGELETAGGVTSIKHLAATDKNALATFPSSAKYGIDAIVMPVEWNFYYVATRPGASTPGLYRLTHDGRVQVNSGVTGDPPGRKDPVEIVSNVETMKIHYGENTLPTTGTPTMEVNEWRTTAADVDDWSRVVAVRIGLMMITSENGVNTDIASTPTLLGAAYTVPTAYANRVRKEFSTTVVLRNRVAPRKF
jgi:type IV pilus assembly protein PilW